MEEEKPLLYLLRCILPLLPPPLSFLDMPRPAEAPNGQSHSRERVGGKRPPPKGGQDRGQGGGKAAARQCGEGWTVAKK